MSSPSPLLPFSFFTLEIIYLLIGSGVLVVSGFVGFLIAVAPRPRKRTEKEKYYMSAKSENPQLLPNIFQEATTDLTVVVPAYNEATRLPKMLEETVTFLEERRKRKEFKDWKYEILIVNDGSTDSTTDATLEFGKENPDVELRVLILEKNRGKGGAVTQGMLSAGGKYVLFADADGATKFSDLALLEQDLAEIETADGFGAAVGSRAHLVETEAVVKRSFIRNFLMHSFHKVLYILGIRGIGDTQCGFKLFTRKSAQRVFINMHVERWIFDIEMLLIAQQFKTPIAETAVSWHEIDGSKVSLVKDSIQMALDLLTIRLNYLFGIWTVNDPLKPKRD
ncbi:10895_t:CDS:2 [Ambispora gerdemannii]|uniref:dolichyl-phosphate beta-glucosyltransferase n=1 Tax=Ambispora gerdemannii TaxID=144530 RepID=A0A9N8YKU8_9GLOM|nr:10895_t:CDS:2 [Ambispora gerdemannii]